jgi:hypothetical protein
MWDGMVRRISIERSRQRCKLQGQNTIIHQGFEILSIIHKQAHLTYKTCTILKTTDYRKGNGPSSTKQRVLRRRTREGVNNTVRS